VATLPAHLVATPVLERVGGERRGVVLGVGATACWVEVDGLVVAITTREVPLLPNAIALAAGSGSLAGIAAAPGSTARFGPGRVDLGPLQITWDPAAPPTWDPTVPTPAGTTQEAVAQRGAALLDALGVRPNPLPLQGPRQRRDAIPIAPSQPPELAQPRDLRPAVLVRELARLGLATAADPDGAAGLTLLLQGLRERDPETTKAGASDLLGRGPGLTPEGDDLLTGAAGVIAVLGPAAGLERPVRDALLVALAPDPGRTTALSATLLALAARGRLAEPAGRLLDLGPAGEAAWPGALARLGRLGHGSGRAYAVGIAATACLLAAGAPLR
jgi:hypothetical protein